MKLFLDDVRQPLDDSWTVARSSAEALTILKQARDDGVRVKEISFDHDLGGDDTSRRVMYWIVASHEWPTIITIHTANPVGKSYLYGMATTYAPKNVTVRLG